MVTPDQVDSLMKQANAVGPVDQVPATPSELADQNAITAAALGSSTSKSQPAITPTLGGPAAASPANAAPAFSSKGFTGSFADKLAAATNPLIKAGVDPMTAILAGSLHALGTDTPSGTSSWADSLADKSRTQPTTPPPPPPSNAQRIIRGIEGGLSDIGAATEGGPAGGAIAGAARVAKASVARRQQEAENKIKMATANTQMLHEQMLIHQLGEEQVEKSAAAGRQSLDESLMAPGAEVLASNKTSDDITQMINNKALDPSKDAIFLTGRQQVGQDANGMPMFRSVYTVVKPGGRIAPTQSQIDFLNKYIPGSNFKGPDDVGEGKDGQSFDSHTWYMLNQRAMTNMAQVQTIQKVSDENEERAHKIALEKGNDAFVSNPAIMHAFNAVARTGKYDPYLAAKAFQELQREVSANPEILKDLPKNWAEQFAYTYGGGDPKKFEDQINRLGAITEKIQDTQHDLVQSYIDDPSKYNEKTAGIITSANAIINDKTGKYSDEQKDQAVQAKNMAIAQKQQEIQDKVDEDRKKKQAEADIEATGTNGSTETGAAFLATLPPARRAVVEGYINGTSTFTPRMSGSKFGQEILRDIRQAAGADWDESKGTAYAEARKKFTSGKEATAINAANTAIHHMVNMWGNLDAGATAGLTGSLEQFLGANVEGRRLADAAKAVASELGRLYTGGVIGEKDQKEWADKLDPRGFGNTANKLRTNLKEFMELLGGKLQSLQAQWDDAVPSAAIHFSKGIISKDNLEQLQNITGKTYDIHDTQFQQNYATPTTAAPAARPTNQGGPAQGGVIVNVPDGKGGTVPMQFKSQQDADAFKAKAGLQ